MLLQGAQQEQAESKKTPASRDKEGSKQQKRARYKEKEMRTHESEFRSTPASQTTLQHCKLREVNYLL